MLRVISLGFCSTLLVEALALSTKTLSIDPSGSDNYFFFDDELRYKFKNSQDLSHTINTLLDMPYEDYWNNIKNYLPLLMNINKKSLPSYKNCRIC